MELAPSRGRVAALVGAVLTTAGDILFAMGAGAFATFSWFATAPGPAEGAGRSLVAHANGQVLHLLGPDRAGFVVYTLGSLVLAAAPVRARAVPPAPVAVFVVGTPARFVSPAGNDVLNDLQVGLSVPLVVRDGRPAPRPGVLGERRSACLPSLTRPALSRARQPPWG